MGKHLRILLSVTIVVLFSGCTIHVHNRHSTKLKTRNVIPTIVEHVAVKPYVGHHIGATAGYAVNKYPAKIDVYTQQYGGPLPVPPSVYRQSTGVIASHTKRG